MQVNQVLETCLYVKDLPAAEIFYRRVLGLRPFSRVTDRHVFFRLENAVFLLFNPQVTVEPGGQVPPHGAAGAGHVAFAIQAAEIPAWREHLIRQGVNVEMEVNWPGGGFSLYFRDPAGNSLELATHLTWGF